MNLKIKFLRGGPRTPELPIPAGAMTWLMVCLFITIAWHTWHIPELPVWAFFAVVPMGIFSYRRIIKEKPLPSPVFRHGLTLASVTGIVLTFGYPLGRDPGITTLMLLSSLKLMELKSRRDYMFVVFMCYFLIFGNFLYDQSLPDLAFMIVAFILVTAAVLRLNHPTGPAVKTTYLLRFSLRLLMMAIPFTVMLFLLFPRVYGGFWNLPQDKRLYQSGFRDSLQPGDVSELAQSNALVFNVEFPNDNMPGRKDLYFRGLVLWFTDGKAWYQGRVPSTAERNTDSAETGILQYITLQPHNREWLFALDRPVGMERWVRILPGNIYQALWKLDAPFRYRVVSRPDAGPDSLPSVYRQWALQLPDTVSPRIKALARRWRNNAAVDSEVVRQAMAYFQDNGFSYSLSPGQMDPADPLADFLFNKRKGFCEHYAAAFTLLMRSAGIPARVVVGYQGGEFNPIGKYLEIRQLDAHAWSEVWLEAKAVNGATGWQRVDPTGWVSPERIEYGLEISLAIAEKLNSADRDQAIQDALKGNFLKRAWTFIKNNWENIKYKWDSWIITYDIWRQRDFLSNLGLGGISRWTLLLIVISLALVLLVIFSLFLRRKISGKDPLLILYRRFCMKLEQAGLQRLRWEGPVHFEQRAIKKFPQKAEVIRQITDLFVHLRYGRLDVTKDRLNQLKSHIRNMQRTGIRK